MDGIQAVLADVQISKRSSRTIPFRQRFAFPTEEEFWKAPRQNGRRTPQETPGFPETLSQHVDTESKPKLADQNQLYRPSSIFWVLAPM